MNCYLCAKQPIEGTLTVLFSMFNDSSRNMPQDLGKHTPCTRVQSQVKIQLHSLRAALSAHHSGELYAE